MDVTMLNEISDEVKKYNARLLPVIKGRETEEISKVYNEGFREFGENRLEELFDHKSKFKDCHFHFIAPLQSRKIPEILENSKSAATLAKTKIHQSHTQGKLIRIWCQGLHPLCGVHRSPDWLISRPLAWLSCHKGLYHLSLSPRLAEGLDVADLSQDGKFASVFLTEAFHVDARSIGCPVATRGSSY